MDVKTEFVQRVELARYAIDALEDILKREQVSDDKFMAMVSQLDQAGLLMGWDGPEIDQLRDALVECSV